MKLLWVSAILPLVFAQTEFGTSHLSNSSLCSQWSCLNDHLGLSDTLPRREQYTAILQGLLPAGGWQDAVGSVLDACYGERPRRYTNTCPGQALTHCVVDQLIENCPNNSWITKDACAPVSSVAGFRYMFSQSRYNDLEKNLPADRRPAWFLNNYFNVKCCDLPPLFNETLLKQCGFHSVMYYYQQQTRTRASTQPTHTYKVEENQRDKGDVVQVVQFDEATTTPSVVPNDEYDPLDCCDMHEFISPTWRSHCDFQLKWDPATRLSIKPTAGPVSLTTTESPQSLKSKDVKMVPQSCDKNNCVFRALNIVSDTGFVDIDAFAKLLNNLTDIHPAWTKAKGRVLTKCLSRPIRDYEYDCHVNKILACTFDVLSENCPNSKAPDVCRHSGSTQTEAICQISSSKYRPRNRRLFCGIPNLVKYEVLNQCGLNSLIQLEYVPETIFKPRAVFNSISSTCKDSTPSTICLMDQMGVLNKYDFMDYFKMKDRIRSLNFGDWYPFSNALTAVFQSVPLYKEYCVSPKKLLNVIDSMLMVCPFTKRRQTPQCDKLFSDVTRDISKNATESERTTFFGHVFITNQHTSVGDTSNTRHSMKVETNPVYDFGILNSNAPPIVTVDLKPKKFTPPLVLLPVYQRMPFKLHNKDNIMRSAI